MFNRDILLCSCYVFSFFYILIYSIGSARAHMDEIKLHWNCLPIGNVEMNNRTLVSVQTKHTPIFLFAHPKCMPTADGWIVEGKTWSWMISKFVPVLCTHFVHTLRAKPMVGLTAWLVIAAQLGSCLAMPRSARRQLGRHYNHPKDRCRQKCRQIVVSARYVK